MYALIETGGKQYRVQEQAIIEVEKLPGEAGTELALERVLLLERDGEVLIGRPTVEGAKVVCKVIKQDLGKKVDIFTFKAKKNEHRRMGHRQQITRLLVKKIEGPGEPAKEQDNGA